MIGDLLALTCQLFLHQINHVLDRVRVGKYSKYMVNV
jgi:hypothetical protein